MFEFEFEFERRIFIYINGFFSDASDEVDTSTAQGV